MLASLAQKTAVIPGVTEGPGKGIQGPEGEIPGPWIPSPSLASLASGSAGDDRSWLRGVASSVPLWDQKKITIETLHSFIWAFMDVRPVG